jgi:hypothetical protein
MNIPMFFIITKKDEKFSEIKIKPMENIFYQHIQCIMNYF